MSANIEGMLEKREDKAPVEGSDFSAQSDAVERVVDDYVIGEEGGSKEKRKRVPKEYSFTLRYEGGDGEITTGEFTNRVLKTSDHITVGVIRSKLTRGVPVESLDSFTAQLSEAIAHCSVSLIKRPAWAKNMAALEDPQLVLAIYAEVDGHEATFRGHVPDTASSV